MQSSASNRLLSLRRVVFLALVFVAAPLQAQEGNAFVVKRAQFTMAGSLLRLDLEVDIDIPRYIATAVDQGFAVPLMFEVEIRATRNYWIDAKLVALKQQYLLHYLPMLGSYVIIDINASERHYYDSRKAAVRSIQVVYNYPMFDIGNLARHQQYYARVRYGIDTDELPQPLKSSSLWDNDWDLASDWYVSELERPEL